MNSRAPRIARYAFLAAVIAAGLFTIVASNGGGPSSPPATTGAISVSTGFGAVTSTPYQCTGQGNITITPQSLTGTTGTNTSQKLPFSYSGFSSTTPNEPACQQTVIFTALRTGSWQVTNGSGVCTATVIAGSTATVKIWNGVCQ